MCPCCILKPKYSLLYRTSVVIHTKKKNCWPLQKLKHTHLSINSNIAYPKQLFHLRWSNWVSIFQLHCYQKGIMLKKQKYLTCCLFGTMINIFRTSYICKTNNYKNMKKNDVRTHQCKMVIGSRVCIPLWRHGIDLPVVHAQPIRSLTILHSSSHLTKCQMFSGPGK